MRVVGLDLSLRATGYAHPNGGTETLTCHSYGVDRLIEVRAKVAERLRDDMPDLVCVEGYAHGRTNQAHQIGELGGLIRVEMFAQDLRYEVIPPNSLKMFATGRGNADKGAMLAHAIRRLGYDGSDHNQADALWLRAIGHALAGEPIVELPQTHMRALTALTKGAA